MFVGVIYMFQLRTCLKCGWEWNSNDESKRPQCSRCGSTKTILSKDIPPHLKFKKEIDALKDELYFLKDVIKQLSGSQEQSSTKFTEFELKVTHNLKDLLFWKNVFRERTDPPKHKKSPSSKNPESELRPVHRKILPPKQQKRRGFNTAPPPGVNI